jgi:uncharacterized membrane protein
MSALLRTASGRVAVGLLLVLALGVVAGLVALRPGEVRRTETFAPDIVQSAEVTAVRATGCEELAGAGCRMVDVVLGDGPDAGSESYLALPDGVYVPDLEPGDRIVVARYATGPNAPALDDRQAQPLAFVDFDRGASLTWLAVAFAVIVVALARWQGVRSLLGLALSLLVVVLWLLPALLSGRPPLLAALVGGLAVMLATTGITHGLGLKSAAAMLGAAVTLVLIVVLAVLAVDLARITGLSSEEATLIEARTGGGLSLQGLVLAGIVIGALGVLDDVTISQASTVLALRRANPRLRARALFSESMAVGRDHLGATVNTLVLAYAGASLPVLLIFSGQGTAFGEAVTREAVAEEIVATLVGSTGLVAAVPLTTMLTVLLAVRLPSRALPAHRHAH